MSNNGKKPPSKIPTNRQVVINVPKMLCLEIEKDLEDAGVEGVTVSMVMEELLKFSALAGALEAIMTETIKTRGKGKKGQIIQFDKTIIQ